MGGESPILITMARISKEARAQVRKRLVETAARHFAEHGLEATNVDRIALESGYAKGTFYNYFDSKMAIFGEVIQEGCRRAVERYSVMQHEGSVRSCLLALAISDAEVLRERDGFMKVAVREAMSFKPETYPLIVMHMAPCVDKVEEILSRGVASGEVRDDQPPAQLALAFVGILVLLYVQHWGSDGAWPSIEEVPELATSLFFEGAATRSTSDDRGKKNT